MKRTLLYEEHLKLGAEMVEFGGWEMPLNYTSGILSEHMTTRRFGGLFDVSHMGRFLISGEDALPFMQYVLTNNAAALDPGQSQYTIIPNESGGAVDDAYLYRMDKDEEEGRNQDSTKWYEMFQRVENEEMTLSDIVIYSFPTTA